MSSAAGLCLFLSLALASSGCTSDGGRATTDSSAAETVHEDTASVPDETVAEATTAPADSMSADVPETTAPADSMSGDVPETTAPADSMGADVAETTPEDVSGDSRVVDLAFAANFAAGGDCRTGIASSACDLYLARVKVDDGTVLEVMRATATPEAESFPSWHPTADVVYASSALGDATNIIAYDRTGDAVLPLVTNAKQPDVAADGTIVYADLASHEIMRGMLDGAGIRVTDIAPLTGVGSQFEPRISADGRRVAFYQEFPGSGATHNAQGRVYDRTLARTLDLSTADGTAHCTIDPSGALAVCQNTDGVGLTGYAIAEDGSVGVPTQLVPKPTPQTLGAIDAAFATCDAVSFSYLSFCTDAQHFVVTAQCGVGPPQPHGGNATFSRLVLVRLDADGPHYAPLGRDLATSFTTGGGANAGSDSFTARCR